tara:strand:- start:207 stop:1307 length:1101 start_codon:yes stop_codon:yes gene_type:complete
MDGGFSEIAKALMPYETSNNSLSRPEAKGLEWLSEKLANERYPWTLHEGGVISIVHGGGGDAVVILLNVRGTVRGWLKDQGRHIHVYVLPMWYEDCLGPNKEIGLIGGALQHVCVRSPGSPTATDACVSMIMAADNGGTGLSKVKTIREAIANQQQNDRALMDSALLVAKELFLKTGIHPELREAWGIEDYQDARLVYNAGYYGDARSALRGSCGTLQASHLQRARRLLWLSRINKLGSEIAKHPGMPDEIYCKVLELCKDEDWGGCEIHLAEAHQALEDWKANQERQAMLKQEGIRKLREALKLKAKYPDHLKLGGFCEEAAGMAEAGDWASSLEPLEQVAKLRSRLEWDEVVEEAWRLAQTSSW